MRAGFFTLILLVALPLLGEETIAVKKVRITGLKNIGKGELFRGVKTSINGRRIYIDRQSFENRLGNHPMIEKYVLDVKQNILNLEVIEKYPLFLVVMYNGKESIPFLLDMNLNLIKRGLFFQTDMPIIEMEEEDYEYDRKSNSLVKLFKILSRLSVDERSFHEELSSIKLENGGNILVRMKGRKTEFLLRDNMFSFLKLKGAVKVLDSREATPEFLNLTENFVLIR